MSSCLSHVDNVLPSIPENHCSAKSHVCHFFQSAECHSAESHHFIVYNAMAMGFFYFFSAKGRLVALLGY